MVKKILLLFIFIVAAIPFKVLAGGTDTALKGKVSQWLNNASGIRFLENKGQMFDEQRKPVPNVLYEASGGGMDVYVTNTGLSYVFVKLEKHKKKNSFPLHFKEHNDSITEQYCRADMQLVGASIKKENIVKEGESIDRSDYYYGGVCPNGILGVHSYEKITIKNIYPGIDWVLHGGKNGLKYDFIVHPGADPSQIKLKYKWTTQPQLQTDGSVKISTPMGNITEGTPVSYCNSEQVQTTYAVKDSEIHFNVGDYNSAQPLIIDPQLVWATYYGPGIYEGDDVFSMQDDGTNVWISGRTNAIGFPVFNPGGGAYFQGTVAGQYDAFILQFSVAGVLKWGTCYGGTGNDAANSIYSDGSNVWVTGYTGSSNFHTLNPGGGAYFQGAPAGSINAFILQFNTAGVLKWATYYGGNGEDYGYSINSDGADVWIAGQTYSTIFPTLNPGGGAYFQASLNGTANAFVLQFSTSGIRKWATYYGGNQSDVGNSINSDGKNVWVTGNTESTNFPALNPGGGAYYKGTLTGSYDAFLLKFNTSGVRKWATYYGGNLIDYGYSINSDGKNVWVTGKTYSANFPTLNPGHGAYYQGTIPGVSDAFILKFDTSGIRKWATYYGGNARNADGDAGTFIQSERGNIWVCGYTSSTDFPTMNPGCGFFQDTLGINRWDSLHVASQDVFILQFDTVGVRQWATFYGTDIEQDGSYIWNDGTNLFIAGDANYAGYPGLNPGDSAYYFDTTNIGFSNEMVFVGKFSTARGNLTVSPTVSICRGQSDTIRAGGALSYTWSPAAGLSATNIPNPVASPTVTTTYTVTTTGGCAGNAVDSVKVIVDTFNLKKLTITKDTAICRGSSITLSAGGGTFYDWSTGATTNSISITNDSTTQTYMVSVSDGMCKADTSVTVSLRPEPGISVSGNKTVCRGDSVQLLVSGGTSYKWSNGYTGSSYSAIVNSATTFTVTAYNSSGCSHDTVITIAPDIPVLSACCNTIILAGDDTTLVANGNTTKPYLWSPSVTCINPPLCDSVKVSPTVTTTYTVTMTDSTGCEIEQILTIDVETFCADFIVPNVFTPAYAGMLGVNNVFYIKTANLDSWSITIYDRWGKEMYNSINPNEYWDGKTEGGGNVPAGVYYYIINASCQNNSFKKDGFVQLIR